MNGSATGACRSHAESGGRDITTLMNSAGLEGRTSTICTHLSSAKCEGTYLVRIFHSHRAPESAPAWHFHHHIRLRNIPAFFHCLGAGRIARTPQARPVILSTALGLVICSACRTRGHRGKISVTRTVGEPRGSFLYIQLQRRSCPPMAGSPRRSPAAWAQVLRSGGNSGTYPEVIGKNFFIKLGAGTAGELFFSRAAAVPGACHAAPISTRGTAARKAFRVSSRPQKLQRQRPSLFCRVRSYAARSSQKNPWSARENSASQKSFSARSRPSVTARRCSA